MSVVCRMRILVLLCLLLCLFVLAGCEEEPVETYPIETESVTSMPSPETVPDPMGKYMLARMSGVLESLRLQAETVAYYVEANYTGAPWYERSRLIYHAGGVVDGVTYTNSREAIEQTLSRGDMLLEIDFLFTSDGHLVCLHEWKNLYGMTRACSLEKFQSLRIYGRFTTITAEEFIDYMREYPDLYLIVDTKEKDSVAVVAELLRLCDYQDDIARRFVIQLYDAGVKAKMCELYDFRDDNFLFTAYKFGPSRTNAIMDLCKEEGITVITVPYGSWGSATVERFLAEGFLIFEHTVNDTKMTDASLGRGVYGFYTDTLMADDLGLETEG